MNVTLYFSFWDWFAVSLPALFIGFYLALLIERKSGKS